MLELAQRLKLDQYHLAYMQENNLMLQEGRVASLHLHPTNPGAELQSVETVDFVEAQGIQGDTRYFGRLSRTTGEPTRRQVTLMEREQISEHATALGLPEIAPGAVRSNVETTGIDLVALLGREVVIGEAVLFLVEPRDPCEKMDAICQGLRERMLKNRQGVLAQVRRSGTVRIGDAIRVLNPGSAGVSPAS
jgi:MOSC domain-containing protein YiiM